MTLSRRKFMGASVASIAVAPTVFNAPAIAQNETSDIDWSMGFPDDATLLNRNENPIGPSPKAIEAAKLGIEKSFRYADSIYIKSLLAGQFDVDADHVLVGTGSGEMLNAAPLAYMTDSNHNMVATWESYRPIPGRAQRLGGKVKWVNLLPEENYQYDVDRLLSAVDENTRLLFMVTPNNPTGTILSYANIKRLADELPEHVLLILDGAYRDFQEGETDEIELVKQGYKNILVTRTFSKTYAMAGLRAGYAVAHPDVIRKIAQFAGSPTSTNMAGFGAMAASIGDMDYLRKSRDFVNNARTYFERELGAMRINTLAGPPIFILAETGENTQAISDELRSRKIFVRPGGEWGMSNHMRVSYGLDHENAAFIAALKDIIG